MKKPSLNAQSFAHITPELLAKVNVVLSEAARNTYSISRIYEAHNAVFQINDPAQSCPTCLTTRAAALKEWLTQYNASEGKPAPIIDATAGVFTNEDFHKYMEAKGVDPDNGETIIAALTDLLADPAVSLTDAQRNAYSAVVTGDVDVAQFQVTTGGKADAKPAAKAPAKPKEPKAPAANSDPLSVAPGEGVTRLGVYKLNKETGETEGDAIVSDFTPDGVDVNKGTIKNVLTGKGLAPGKYLTAEDPQRALSVQVGAKATFTEVVEDLT